MQVASKSALEASKTATAMSKNTLDDLTYVGKSTLGDLTKSAKEVVSKKGLLRVRNIQDEILIVIINYKFVFRPILLADKIKLVHQHL